jgi:hypothetical protein
MIFNLKGENAMFKKSVLMGMLALAFATLVAREVLAWDLSPGDPLYGCLDEFCSYQGDVIITGAKGKSVAAGTVSVLMQQVAEQGHVLGFCINPQGKLNPIGSAFHINTSSFDKLSSNECDTKGKCPVQVHQVTTVLDLPANCPSVNDGTCPGVCDGQTGEQCLGTIYGIDVDAVCNNNFSFFGLVWDQVNLTFNVIDLSSGSTPVATLNATCTSPDGLVFPQPSPFICNVPKK